MIKLELEITEGMWEELEGICQRQLLPIEHVARGILADHICNLKKQKERPSAFLGFPVARWANAVKVAAAVLTAPEEAQAEE